MTLSRLLLLSFLALAAFPNLGLEVGFVFAGATDPTLAIGQVEARPAGHASVVEVTGTWGFDDVLQVDFPVSVVVYQGSSFVRYPAGGGAESGSFAGLDDGLDTMEIGAIEAAGTSEPSAELLRLEPKRALLSLPPSFVDGAVSVVAYVELPGEGSFVSNTVSTTLVGVQPAN